MMTILTIGFLALIGFLVFKILFFRPDVNIFYLVKLFNAEYRTISIVGEEDDNAPLTFLARPFEKVEPFQFKFQKLVTRTEAEQKKWPITFEFLKSDPKVIVEREEFVPGWRAIELHAVGVEFVTKNGTDISLGLEVAYQPISGEGAVLMRRRVKNWSAYADTMIQNVVGAWGRNKESDEDILNVTIDDIMDEIASDIVSKDHDAEEGESVDDYLNEKFERIGFRMVTRTLYKIVNGPQSQDVKEKREAIKKAQLGYQEAMELRKTDYEKGMALVDLEKASLDNKAAYVERVNKSVNQTAIQVADKLTKLNTLVLGENFSIEAFTGAKAGSQNTGGKS